MVERRDVARLLAGTFLLAGTAGASQAETRALSLYNTHTQERATVVFKRDGSYDSQGLQELNRLLRDWRRNEVTRMDPMLFDLVWDVYRRVGSHQPIHIVSGYRSPATNNALRTRSRGVAKFSQHMMGKAMDFYLPDVPLSKLRETGMKLQMGGVGFYPTSGSPFVHMDTGSVRAWPRMTHDQLVRLFPDGKTAHLPSDGAPLPGYQTALAEVEARKARGGGPVESSSSGGGLLAALFGGGSSSSSSSYTATPGDDEEESAPVRAPAPRKAQELRQGPLPPGANPRLIARAGEMPPGVSGGPSAPQDAGRSRAPAQIALAEEVPLPPRPPVPTATASGSLVAMPVTPPSAGPTRPAAVASAEPMPSRYGPAAATSGGLPPGWIQGPSGRPAGQDERAREAEARPAVVAFSPGLKPIAAPMPQDRPGARPMEMLALAQLAAAPATTGTPIAVALPKPRPTGAMRVAEAMIAPADAHAALSAFTGETDRTVALGYASAAPIAAPEEPIRTAALSPAPSPTRAAATEARSVPESRFSPSAAQARGKADRIGATGHPVAHSAPKTDRADADRIFDPSNEAAGEAFAALKHPDQNALDPLLIKPRMSLAAGFATASLDEGFGAHTFSGPAVISLPVILTQ